MDQIKIGKFIQQQRKEKNITQSELAEILNITGRAISKWENGICLPDISNMIELCKVLNVTINDLFSGEKVNMKNNEKKLEENLIKMTKAKEQKDKQLLSLEIFICILVTIMFIASVFVASYTNIKDIYKILIIIIGFISFVIGCTFCLKIEQTAGYYECNNCHHKYIPTFSDVLCAMHINRTRYLKCPKCSRRSWNKKVISLDKNNE